MAEWRVTVNQSLCVGSGTCGSIAPESFTFDEEGRSCPVSEKVSPSPQIIEAAEMCPTGAIDLVDVETGQSQLD